MIQQAGNILRLVHEVSGKIPVGWLGVIGNAQGFFRRWLNVDIIIAIIAVSSEQRLGGFRRTPVPRLGILRLLLVWYCIRSGRSVGIRIRGVKVGILELGHVQIGRRRFRVLRSRCRRRGRFLARKGVGVRRLLQQVVKVHTGSSILA